MGDDKRRSRLPAEDEVRRYVRYYKSQGYEYSAIAEALRRSGVSPDVVEQCIVLEQVQGKMLMSRRGFIVLITGLVALLLILGLLLFWMLPQQGCSEDLDCSSGSFCSNGECVKPIGAQQCEVLSSCDDGFDCYKCVKSQI